MRVTAGYATCMTDATDEKPWADATDERPWAPRTWIGRSQPSAFHSWAILDLFLDVAIAYRMTMPHPPAPETQHTHGIHWS